MSIFGDIFGFFGDRAKAGASKDAAQIAADSQREGIGETRRQFDATQNNLKPFLKRGNEAGDRLSNLLLGRTTFDPNDTPGYTASLNEGLKATERSAFARGQGLSGRTLASLQDLGQKYSYGAFNNRINQLAGVSGTGQTAGNTLGFLGNNNASNISNLLGNVGDARASGVLGATNANANALGNLGSGVSTAANALFNKDGKNNTLNLLFG